MNSGIRNLLICFIPICVFLYTPIYSCGEKEVEYFTPENMLRFADYLYQERDYLRAAGEYERYLFFSDQDAEGVWYKLGLCYRGAGNNDKAVKFFTKSALAVTESPFHFAASYQIAYSYLLSGRYEDSIQYLEKALDETEDLSERGRFQILAAYNYLHQRRWADVEHALENLSLNDEDLSLTASTLKVISTEGKTLHRKSPALAGLFSAFVPGTGKIYCKQYGDGIYSFIVIGITGWLAWDGFQEEGIRSVRGWLFGTASGIFYTGNIYGSAIAAFIYNRQLETDLLSRLPPVPDVRVTIEFSQKE